MGTYRVEWECCGQVTETDAWEPSECPFCAKPIDLAAQGLGDADELFNTFRLAYYGSNKSLAPELESFRRAYKAIAPPATEKD